MSKTANRKATAHVHPEDIKAMIRKTGVGVTDLSVALGYSANAISMVLKRPSPAVQEAVARYLGVTPQSLWPDRYDQDGHPTSFPASRHSRAHASSLRQKSPSA